MIPVVTSLVKLTVPAAVDPILNMLPVIAGPNVSVLSADALVPMLTPVAVPPKFIVVTAELNTLAVVIAVTKSNVVAAELAVILIRSVAVCRTAPVVLVVPVENAILPLAPAPVAKAP